MKSILTIAILISSLSVIGQTKQELNNYRIEANYVTDCKTGSMFQTFSAPYEATYPLIYKSFKKWVGNHKIISFHITKFEKLKHPDKTKGDKFECEKPFDTSSLLNSITISATTSCDTCHYSLFSTSLLSSTYYYIWKQANKTIISIGSPDSTKTITVTFSKSQVHFINDSTFTFKQK